MDIDQGTGGSIPEAPADEVEEGAPLWTVTFGDMMSLLLTFFILMYSMSELKVERFALAAESFSEALGGVSPDPVESPTGIVPDPVDPELEPAEPGESSASAEEEWVESFTDAYMEMIAQRLEAFVEEYELQELVTVAREGEGIYLRIETTALFESGEALISPEGTEILDYLAIITRELEVPVSVSGHADNVPIRTAPFASNWELSAARAAGVARVMVEAGQDPTTVRVESYGEFRPVADNDTPEGRARNRRVEVFYSRDDIRAAARQWEAEGGAADVPAGPRSGAAATAEGAAGEPSPGN